MKRIYDFLYRKMAIIVGTAVVLLIFLAVFLLGDLDFEYYLIALRGTLFFLLIYILGSFSFYKEEVRYKEKNKALQEELEMLRMEMISKEKDLKDYFILWVHQMKTPITASKLLLENTISDEEQKKLKMQLIYIEQYTDIALDYLKLIDKSTDMDITRVKLNEIIRMLLKKYSVIFIAEHIQLIYEPIEEYVVSDPKWLAIVIEQFISNALKYTKKGYIRISYNANNNVLSITDSGIGIRSEDIPKIFDRGYSGFNGRINQKSSGLGLFLAKKISEKLALEISVSSTLGEGSTFRLHFNPNLTKV